MKNFITTIQNIWKIDELRKRILFTIAILAVYRLGSFIVLPGVIPEKLMAGGQNTNDLLGLVNMFTGGAFNQAALFALGIMPYITASIIIQLLGFAVPYFQRLQQHEGESGRKKIGQMTRILTIFITLVQGSGYLAYLTSQGAVDPNIPQGLFWFSNIIILSAGTILAMWLGEKITDRGIGNGISLLITVGIIAMLPMALIAEIQIQIQNNILLLVFEFAALFFVVLATIAIVQAVRRIALQFANRMVGRGASKLPTSGNRDYLPIKVNAAGVMPIIFAQALMFLPTTVVGFLAGPNGAASPFLRSLGDFTSLPYNIIYFFLIVIFTYVYTALIVNPKQQAEYLKQRNAFIPGVKPGDSTAEYVDTIVSRITLPGSILLGVIAILPGIVAAFGVNPSFAMFFGGTSLLILVAVVLDTLQQIESYLLLSKYDGLVKSGKIQGRTSSIPTVGAGM